MIPRSRAASIIPTLPIPAKDWNVVFDELRNNRPLVVNGIRGGGWSHPWKPTMRWNTESNEWEVRIKPGTVNARLDREVEAVIDLDSAPEVTQDRAGTDDSILVGESRVSAYLTDEPWIPVPSFRSIGPDADQSTTSLDSGGTSGTIEFEDVPDFFKAMGVGEPPDVEFDFSGTITTSISGLIGGSSTPDEERYLRAFDIVLRQERLGTATDWTIGNGIGGVTFAQFDVVYSNVDYKRNATVYLTSKYTPPVEVDLGDKLRGDWTDDPFDEIKIATVYLVSPPGIQSGSDPDISWSPFTRNYVFWNLNHDTNLIPTAQIDSNPITFPFAPLAGGVANQIFDSFLATNNDAFDAAFEFLNNRELKGIFWSN